MFHFSSKFDLLRLFFQEQQSFAVRDSSMTKTKVYATLFVGILESEEDRQKYNDSNTFASYSRV